MGKSNNSKGLFFHPIRVTLQQVEIEWTHSCGRCGGDLEKTVDARGKKKKKKKPPPQKIHHDGRLRDHSRVKKARYDYRGKKKKRRLVVVVVEVIGRKHAKLRYKSHF